MSTTEPAEPAALAGWTHGHFDGDEHGRHGFDTWRRGEGPGVIVVHEVPGITPKVVAFAEEVVAAGFTVVLPDLFGTPGKPMSGPYALASLARGCVNREFAALHKGRTSPVTVGLRALARSLHEELGGPGVGALGMCFTGGFALAMMVDASVAAPVLCQPSLPLPLTPGLGRDLGISPADLDVVKQRVADGCSVLGLRFTKDPSVGGRFETLTRELGDGFIRVEFPGRGHSTVTEHRQQEGVDAVLGFLADRLR